MKKLVALLTVMLLTLSGFIVSFAASPKSYAETDEELLQAEIRLNKAISSINSHDNVTQRSNVLEVKMSNLKSYRDLKTGPKVKDARQMLLSRGYSVDATFAKLCTEIEQYKETNNSLDPKEIVKYFNSKDGFINNSVINVLIDKPSSQTISYSTWTTLTTAEKLLIASNPGAALKTDSIKNYAYNFTTQKFGYNGLGDMSDGFRHGIWNALMTRDISRDWAKAYATAHEDRTAQELAKRADDGYLESQHRNMDLHNNQIGRDTVASGETWANCSDGTLITRISNKLTNTSTGIIWLHN